VLFLLNFGKILIKFLNYRNVFMLLKFSKKILNVDNDMMSPIKYLELTKISLEAFKIKMEKVCRKI